MRRQISHHADGVDADSCVHGKISDRFLRVLDEYKWAFDGLEELCPTQDEIHERFDNSQAAKRRFQAEKDRHIKAVGELAWYKPTNTAELRQKISTLREIHHNEFLSNELLKGVFASLRDFGKVANV